MSPALQPDNEQHVAPSAGPFERDIHIRMDDAQFKRALNRFWYRAIIRRALRPHALMVICLVGVTWWGFNPIGLAVMWTAYGISLGNHVVAYVRYIQASLQQRRSREDPTVVYRFGGNGVSVSTPLESSDLAWKSFKEIWKYPDMWLLFIDKYRFLTLLIDDLDPRLLEYIEQRASLGADGSKCRTCGYDVRGQSIPRCPECGTEYDAGRLEIVAEDHTAVHPPSTDLEPGTIVYLAGPMSGYPEHNFPAFNRVAAELQDAGLEVFNPAENADGDTGQPRAFYMRLDIPALLASEVVVLLPGWQQSRGANLEVWIALDLDIPVLAQRTRHGRTVLEAVANLEPFVLPFKDR